MRWILVVLALLTAGAVVAVASPPSTPSNCTKIGTNERDILPGSPNRDVICAKAGRDYVSGLKGPDLLIGDGGRDTMVGGPGNDHLEGNGGRDNLFAVDGKNKDVVMGGSGNDRCFIDPGDKIQGCETVFRGVSLNFAKALSRAFGGQALVAEDLISTIPTPTPPPPVVTVTDTITITIPTPVPSNCGGHPAPPPIC